MPGASFVCLPGLHESARIRGLLLFLGFNIQQKDIHVLYAYVIGYASNPLNIDDPSVAVG